MNARLNDLDGATRHASAAGRATPLPAGREGSSGPFSAPADLLAFVRAHSVGEAMQALALSRGTVHRLRHGYWPPDARKITQAWQRYQASRAVVASSWFLRRVRAGGLVRHADADYSAPQLEARTGQLLAVARAGSGALIAQTLELPAQRLHLERAAP